MENGNLRRVAVLGGSRIPFARQNGPYAHASNQDMLTAWTKARCLAAVDSELPSRFSVDVAFKRPILLPATVQFAEVSAADAISFGVRDAKRDTQHLDGLIAR